MPAPGSQRDGEGGAGGPGAALLIPAAAQTKSSTNRRDSVGDPRGTGGCCVYVATRRAEGFALHKQQGADWPTAQFRWLFFPTEELSSSGNQTVTLCKICTRLLVASQKPHGNPAPCTPEHNLLQTTCAANHECFPPRGSGSRDTWGMALRQAGSLVCQVLTWLELVVPPSTGSSTGSIFLVALLCWEVLLSLAGC